MLLPFVVHWAAAEAGSNTSNTKAKRVSVADRRSLMRRCLYSVVINFSFQSKRWESCPEQISNSPPMAWWSKIDHRGTGLSSLERWTSNEVMQVKHPLGWVTSHVSLTRCVRDQSCASTCEN